MPIQKKVEPDPWVIDAGPGEWREVSYEGRPDHLRVMVQLAPTTGGVAVAGVQVKRRDGRAVSVRDLHAVRLPPTWALAGDAAARWYPSGERPVARNRWGLRDRLDDRHRMVWELWCRAQTEAPERPIRWMLPQLDRSDATVRRWVHAARERAAELGWETGNGFAAGSTHSG